MWVWLESAVVVRDIDTIVSSKLAIWQIWISIDTLLWSFNFSVIEVQTVNVEWMLLGGIDFHISEKSSGSVHGGNKHTADHGFSVSWAFSEVFPSILLNHCHDVIKGLVLTSGNNSKFSDILDGIWSVEAHSLVHCLGVEVESGLWRESLNNGEKNWGERSWEEWWPVTFWGIDPTIKEVVISVWKTLVSIEVCLSSIPIKLL